MQQVARRKASEPAKRVNFRSLSPTSNLASPCRHRAPQSQSATTTPRKLKPPMGRKTSESSFFHVSDVVRQSCPPAPPLLFFFNCHAIACCQLFSCLLLPAPGAMMKNQARGQQLSETSIVPHTHATGLPLPCGCVCAVPVCFAALPALECLVSSHPAGGPCGWCSAPALMPGERCSLLPCSHAHPTFVRTILPLCLCFLATTHDAGLGGVQGNCSRGGCVCARGGGEQERGRRRESARVTVCLSVCLSF